MPPGYWGRRIGPTPFTDEGLTALRCLAVINQKGGCGKTTTSINLAATLAQLGQRVLLVDMDPQSHCALGLAVPEQQVEYTIGEAMLSDDIRRLDPSRFLWQINSRFDLAPSTVALAMVERKLAEASDRDLRLARVLHLLRSRYDICLIDCPPNIGLLTFNALRAASEVVIPVETAYFALKGATRQLATIRVMAEQSGHAVHVHVLPTMYDVRLRLSREILADLQRHFGPMVLPVSVHYTSKLKEAASFGQPIHEFDPAGKAAQDFEKLAAYLLEHKPEGLPVGITMAHAEQMSDNAAALESAMARIRAAHQGQVIEQAPVPAAVSGGGLATVETPTAPVRPTSGGTDRAAELVQRARALAARANKLHARIAADPQVIRADEQLRKAAAPITDPQARRDLDEKLAKLYGVRQTQQGTLFVQPFNGAKQLAIAADFNNWKPDTTPLRSNQRLGVWETCVPLPPGRYRYRLVVDGRWTTDPHNTYVESNPFGELNNILEIA